MISACACTERRIAAVAANSTHPTILNCLLGVLSGAIDNLLHFPKYVDLLQNDVLRAKAIVPLTQVALRLITTLQGSLLSSKAAQSSLNMTALVGILRRVRKTLKCVTRIWEH
jgi:hypothetical protein